MCELFSELFWSGYVINYDSFTHIVQTVKTPCIYGKRSAAFAIRMMLCMCRVYSKQRHDDTNDIDGIMQERCNSSTLAQCKDFEVQ